MTSRPSAAPVPADAVRPGAVPAGDRAAAPPQVLCCGRPMSAISVTDAAAGELSLVSCSACSRHAWLRDGALLDREGMLAAVRERLAEVPRPRGGRPKGSGKKAVVPAPRTEDPALQRAREMRGMLSGFTVLGQ